MIQARILHEKDNVATLLETVTVGDQVRVLDGEQQMVAELSATSDIPQGHKIALEPCAVGDLLYKYGYVISRATCPIVRGEWVHTQNTESLRGRGDQ